MKGGDCIPFQVMREGSRLCSMDADVKDFLSFVP